MKRATIHIQHPKKKRAKYRYKVNKARSTECTRGIYVAAFSRGVIPFYSPNMH